METVQETLTEIHPLELGKVWQQVLPGLNRLLKKCPDDYTAEDVYVALKQNRATLLLLDGGFLIVQVDVHPANGVRTLVVWMLFCPGAMKRRDAISSAVDGLAKRANCQRVQFKSPLKGWEREALREGYRMKMVTWEKNL